MARDTESDELEDDEAEEQPRRRRRRRKEERDTSDPAEDRSYHNLGDGCRRVPSVRYD